MAQGPVGPSSLPKPKVAAASPTTEPSVDKPAKGLVEDDAQRRNALLLPVARHIIFDQEQIWTSPARLRFSDVSWLFPVAGVTAGLISADSGISKHVSPTSRFVSTSQTLSNMGLGLAAGSAGGLYLLGKFTHDDHKRETGLLAGEAELDSIIFGTVLKEATGRQRPYVGNGQGRFWQRGSSFPSEHSLLAWSAASVVASEYPGALTKVFAYGAASAVSMARITGRQHFPSDVFIGSLAGWGIGRQVYRAHHKLDLNGADWGRSPLEEEKRFDPESIGSTYIALDSWVYPALDRLAALGYLREGFAGLRPWTRVECARLLIQAGEQLDDADLAPTEAGRLYGSLRTEFSGEVDALDGKPNGEARVESLYARLGGTAGAPLRDFHFGETDINDFGRPYGAGFNGIAGFTSRAEQGPLSIYVRGEYQYAPGAAAYPLDVRQAIARVDTTPVAAATPLAGADRVQLLDSYAAVTLGGHMISVGKQSLWWGPGQGGAMLMSNNAEPIYMLRVNRITPVNIPGLSKLLGPMRYDNFFGRLAGHLYPRQPFFYGQKLSFKPTQNLEFGFSRTAMFGGDGHAPLTWHTFLNSFLSANDVPLNVKLSRNDPGARHAGFDFSYRLPGLRNWVTLYTDSLTHDDVSPISSPRRSAVNSGIYLPRLPKLPRLDLRIESVYTDVPSGGSVNGAFQYWEFVYRDGYVNDKRSMGSWIGREGKGLQAWSTYWLSPNSTVQFGYRHGKVAKDFIPFGETQNDWFVNPRLRIRSNLELSAFFQFEQWKAPLLAPGRVTDASSWIQFSFWPAHFRSGDKP